MMIKVNKMFILNILFLLLINYTIGNFISYSLTLVLIIIFLVDLVLLLLAKIFLNIKMNLSEVAIVGEKNSIVYLISNLSRALTTNIFVSNKVINDISAEGASKIQLDGEKTQYDFVSQKRGKYLLDSIDVELQSILTLISIKRKYKINKLIKIYPKTFPMSCDANLYGSNHGSYESLFSSKDRTSNINDVREYEIGDSIEDIHWKVTAKENKLYTKTYVKECNEEKLIITSYKLEENDYNYILEERITSFVISLCNDFVNKNHNISLLINNGENMSFDIYNNFDIGNLLEYSLENKFSFDGDNYITCFNDIIRSVKCGKNVILIISNIDDEIKKIIDMLEEKNIVITVYFDSCDKNYNFSYNVQLININDYIKGENKYEERNIS